MTVNDKRIISFCFWCEPEFHSLKLPELVVGGDMDRSIHKQPPF